MTALVKVTRKYALLSGAELAYAGTWWLTTGTSAAFVSAYESQTAAYWSTMNDWYADTVSWVETVYTEVDPTTGIAVASLSEAGPGAGVDTNPELPPQCSVVLSIRTPFAGASARGRSYLPAPSTIGLTQLGRLSATFCNALVGAEDVLISAVNSAANSDIGVYSRKNLAFLAANVIEVGDVVDTQRSRRNDLTETRYSASV